LLPKTSITGSNDNSDSSEASSENLDNRPMETHNHHHDRDA
jgi:hypothetical protein